MKQAVNLSGFYGLNHRFYGRTPRFYERNPRFYGQNPRFVMDNFNTFVFGTHIEKYTGGILNWKPQIQFLNYWIGSNRLPDHLQWWGWGYTCGAVAWPTFSYMSLMRSVNIPNPVNRGLIDAYLQRHNKARRTVIDRWPRGHQLPPPHPAYVTLISTTHRYI